MDEHEGIERAIVDRIVDGQAVLLVGDQEAEHHVDASGLPDGAREGSWLLVRVPEWTIVGVDEAGAGEKRRELSARMEELRRRRAGGRFSR